MHFYSGPPMHLLSGVDTDSKITKFLDELVFGYARNWPVAGLSGLSSFPGPGK